MAPDVEMSSASGSITASRPLTYKRTQLPDPGLERIGSTARRATASCWERPWEKVTCRALRHQHRHQPRQRHLALRHLAGARQAALLGLRGIALSAPATDREQPSFELLKPWARACWRCCSTLPTCRSSTSTSLLRAAARHALDLPVDAALRRQGRSPRIRWGARSTGTPWCRSNRPRKSDRWAFDHGYVSITPLRLDLTDHEALERVRQLESWKEAEVRVGPVVRIGISGWRYEPWRGVFYPEGLAQRRELEFCGQHFPASRSTARSIRCSAPSTTRPGTARRRPAFSSA